LKDSGLEADECAEAIAEINRQLFSLIADQAGTISSKNDSQLIALQARLRGKIERLRTIVEDEVPSLRMTHKGSV